MSYSEQELPILVVDFNKAKDSDLRNEFQVTMSRVELFTL